MDSDDMLTTPEKLASLRFVHLYFRPDRNLRIDDGKEFVKIRDFPVNYGIDPKDLSQFLGGQFIDLFGIGQVGLRQQIVDLRDLHVLEGKGTEVVVKAAAHRFEPQFALRPIPEGENRHRKGPVFLHIGINLVGSLELGNNLGGDEGLFCGNHATADEDRQQQGKRRRRLSLPERFHRKPPADLSIASDGPNHLADIVISELLLQATHSPRPE